MAIEQDTKAGAGTAMPQFTHLAERALALLEADGEWQDAASLTAHVLGPNFVHQPFFIQLLAQQLAADGRLSRNASGQWGLAAWSRHDPPLRHHEFVAIDVETTGGQAERHRITEVAAIHLRGGRLGATYQSLVNPLRPLPQFVTKFTGITQEMVDAAPFASQVLQEFRAFVSDRTLVGHNVAADLAFLNYEALWHGLPAFSNAALDTEELAIKLLPGLRKPSLDRVAAALGFNPPLRHRALPDAQVTAQILAALLERLDSAQVRTFAELQRWLESRLAAREERRRLVRTLLPPGTLQALPEQPGIYVFKDASGQALYVGKAINLRDRVAGHFTSAANYARKFDGLLERTAAIEHRVLGSELAALLAESETIRALQPSYNVQVRSLRGCPFLRLDGSVFPRPSPANAVEADVNSGARYFGPYRTTRAVRHMITTLYRVFQLRTCRRTLPAKRRQMRIPCVRLGQHLCPAPCAELVTPEQYALLVHYAIIFLTHGRDAALDALERRLAEPGIPASLPVPLAIFDGMGDARGSARAGRRTRAGHAAGGPSRAAADAYGGSARAAVARTAPKAEVGASAVPRDGSWEESMLRECLVRLRRVRREHRPIDGSLAGGALLLAYPAADEGAAEVFLLREGQLLAREQLSLNAPPARRELVRRIRTHVNSGAGTLDLDRTNLLLRWVYRRYGTGELIAIDYSTRLEDAAAALAARLSNLRAASAAGGARPQTPPAPPARTAPSDSA